MNYLPYKRITILEILGSARGIPISISRQARAVLAVNLPPYGVDTLTTPEDADDEDDDGPAPPLLPTLVEVPQVNLPYAVPVPSSVPDMEV